MLLAVIAIAGGGLAGLAFGGRLANLSAVTLRSVWLLGIGAACEFAVSLGADGTTGLVLLLAGYIGLLGFALRNIRLTGAVLIAAGLLSNLVVIAVDGGMPVRGVPAGVSFGPRHHGEGPGDHLIGLADVVSVSPLGEMVSGGDIVLGLGAATLTFGLLRPPRSRPKAYSR